MAEENDQNDKTEEPTQRRLEDARRKGQVATSRELNHWFMILAATVTAGLFLPSMLGGIEGLLLPFVAEPEAIAADPAALRRHAGELFLGLLLVGAVPLALTLAAAVAPSLLQHGWLVSAEQLKPKLEKISPAAGFKRLFSTQSLTEFVKSLAKLAIVGAVGLYLLWPMQHQLANLPFLETAQLLDLAQSLAMRLLLGVLAVMTVVGALDLLYQKLSFLKRLRMSRSELREEFKQSEGDPVIKNRLRQIRMERARRRMMAAVPDADVVVTNPTHFAVALKYDAASMAAPRVTAKGADILARRIRQVAEENAVPVVENPPLARGLYAAVELDEEIPPEHYKAVAEVIGYVMRLRRGVARPRQTFPGPAAPGGPAADGGPH